MNYRSCSVYLPSEREASTGAGDEGTCEGFGETILLIVWPAFCVGIEEAGAVPCVPIVDVEAALFPAFDIVPAAPVFDAAKRECTALTRLTTPIMPSTSRSAITEEERSSSSSTAGP